MKLPHHVEFILNKLNRNGFEGYAVGGCVRDSLLGKEPNDWDICTNAKPKQILELFRGFHIIPTGLKHGTVTIHVDNENYEVTTYRVDGDYSDGRHPDSVQFTTDLSEDLSRRDFTINALAYRKEEGIVDVFGGIEDLKKKKIRCVGKPIDRFNEDALRILRALRFSAVLGFDIEDETKEAIFKLYKNLDLIAKERINAEFSKLLCGKSCVKILKEFEEVFFYIIPELKKLKGFEQQNPHHIYDIWYHSLSVLDNVVKATGSEDICLELRLAALFHDIGKPEKFEIDKEGIGHFYGHPEESMYQTEEILKNLKFSNEQIAYTKLLIQYHDYQFAISKKALRKLLNKKGFDIKSVKDLLILRKCDILGQSPAYFSNLDLIEDFEKLVDNFKVEEECFSLKQLKVNGTDLMNIGYPAGKQLGVILNDLLNLIIEEKLENDRDKLFEYINKNYKK